MDARRLLANETPTLGFVWGKVLNDISRASPSAHGEKQQVPQRTQGQPWAHEGWDAHSEPLSAGGQAPRTPHLQPHSLVPVDKSHSHSPLRTGQNEADGHPRARGPGRPVRRNLWAAVL